MGALPHDITLLGYEIWIMNICHIVCRFCLSLAHKVRDHPILERCHELARLSQLKSIDLLEKEKLAKNTCMSHNYILRPQKNVNAR
jgi:hypothetical protein